MSSTLRRVAQKAKLLSRTRTDALSEISIAESRATYRDISMRADRPRAKHVDLARTHGRDVAEGFRASVCE